MEARRHWYPDRGSEVNRNLVACAANQGVSAFRCSLEAVRMESPAKTTPPALWRSIGVQILVPSVIGVVTGALVAASSLLVEERALVWLASLPGLVPAVPSLVCLLVTLLVVRYVTRASEPSTSEVYIVAYNEPSRPIVLRELPGRILGAVTTVAAGGSQGLESPSALIGASLGQWSGGRLRVHAEEKRSWVVAGASAGIAAVFSSPGVGALYGLELPFRRDVDAPRLVPSVVAAGASYLTRSYLVGARHLIAYDGAPTIDTTFLLACAAVVLACGLGARLFARATATLRALAHRVPPWARAAAGGVVLALLAWSGHAMTGTWITFGPGYVAAGWLDQGDHAIGLLLGAMLIRTAGTLACVFGGGGGGVFTSLAITGVFIGDITAHFLGHTETRFLALLGGACFLAGGYRIPLAGILLIAETTGNVALTTIGLIGIGAVQIFMGEDSVSDAKRDRRETHT